jgi:hypothetical protein
MLCNKQTIDLLKPENDTVTLGHTYSVFSEYAVKSTRQNVVKLATIDKTAKTANKTAVTALVEVENLKESGGTTDLTKVYELINQNADNIASILSRLTALENAETLPYTLLEYIESTGTQYIDTGFKPNQDTRVVMDFESMASGVGWFFGARTDAKTKTFSLVQISTKSIRNDNGSTQSTLTVDSSQKRTTIDRNGEALSFGSYSIANSVETFSSEYPLALFGVNHAGTVESDSRIIGKLYSCRIYDNDVLIRDFIPIKDTNNVVCLYDKVTKTFFYNAGTGEFIGG